MLIGIYIVNIDNSFLPICGDLKVRSTIEYTSNKILSKRVLMFCPILVSSGLLNTQRLRFARTYLPSLSLFIPAFPIIPVAGYILEEDLRVTILNYSLD